MPKQPSWLNKVNYVVDYWIDPCHAPVLVYLELALPPLGDALLAWFSFGLDDVLRGYLRPSKALGSNVRGRRGKDKKPKTRIGKKLAAGRELIRMVPGLGDDVGNWIGKSLPGAQLVKGRRIDQVTRFLWIIDDIAQRALLALLIADLTVDFLYEWATLLNESEFCHREKSGSLYANGPGTSAGGIFICNTVGADNIVWRDGPCNWVNSVGSVGPGPWNCVSAIQVHNGTASPQTHWQRAMIDDLYGFREEIRGTHTLAPGETAASVANWSIDGPGSIVVNHCATFVVGARGADVTLFGGP